MATVYVVTQGEHSDYRISAVFSTRTLADAMVQVLMEKYPAHYPQVEEWSIDEAADRVARGELRYAIKMFRSGDSTQPWIDYSGGEETDLRKNSNGVYYLSVARWARAPEDVVKIANEIRARMIASGEWPAE